jgi:hypothetical protein
MECHVRCVRSQGWNGNQGQGQSQGHGKTARMAPLWYTRLPPCRCLRRRQTLKSITQSCNRYSVYMYLRYASGLERMWQPATQEWTGTEYADASRPLTYSPRTTEEMDMTEWNRMQLTHPGPRHPLFVPLALLNKVQWMQWIELKAISAQRHRHAAGLYRNVPRCRARRAKRSDDDRSRRVEVRSLLNNGIS